MTDPDEFRIEVDSMGDVRVRASAKWAAQTQRAVENFPISSLRVEPALLIALARIKKAAARQNSSLGLLDVNVSEAICSAASEVIDGNWLDQFPVDVFQTGSGTSTNMNMNEVLATLANERVKSGTRVHPNDHVNASQSSNDVFPSAIHVASACEVNDKLIPALRELAVSLRAKSTEFSDVVKSGRTHLMDATPVTLGQEFGGYASAIERGIERVQSAMARVCELPLGGTAVGTGINAPLGFAKGVIEQLSAETQLPFVEAADHFEAQSSRDAIVELSGDLRVIAISLYKIANDLRWMASGPRTGLCEIHLPDLQPGSSIMPGKVNPVVPEAVCQVVAQVIGNDATVAFGGSAGNFELNVMLPVIARNVLESIRLLASVSQAFATKCIDGIVANVQRCQMFAESSPSVGTALNLHIGYDAAAKVIKQSLAEDKTIKQVVLENQLMSSDMADRVLDVRKMTKGGVIE